MMGTFCHPFFLSWQPFPLPQGDWHPAAVHFPLAFLAASGLFWLLVLLPGKNHHLRRFYACLVLLLGYAGLLLALETGERAAEKLDRPAPPVLITLEEHDTAARQTRLYYTIVFCGAVLAFLFGLLSRRKKRPQSVLFLDITMVVLTFAGLYFLYKTAHSGGRMVHRFGVHADVFQARARVTTPPVPDAVTTPPPSPADHEFTGDDTE